MKFLLDVCAASRALREALAAPGHDVRSARGRYSHAADETLLALAYEEGRVLVTEDKDFGEPVFLRRLPHPCIVRPVELQGMEKVQAMRDLIERRSDAMRSRAVIAVTGARARIRTAHPGRRDDGQAPLV